MRSTLFLAALAAGTAHAYEKRVYVTDWTTVTVTKTVTAPAVTETVTPAQQVQVADTVFTTSTEAPAIVQTTSTSELAKKSTEAVPDNEPATTQAAQVQQEPATSWFSTAWTSTFEAASSTLQPQAQTTSSSTTQAAAASTSSASNGDLTAQYKQAVLYNHNIHRSNHSASSLDWHDDLYTAAKTLADRCVYEHDTDIDKNKVKYGQNIGYGVTEDAVGQMISNLMYNDEIGYYPQPYGEASPSMDLFDKWGHFSQIVWKGTTHVACATSPCKDGLGNVDGNGAIPFTVCNYSPPGNYDGEYGDNVLAPGDASTYTA